VVSVLAISVAAVLAGARACTVIAEWAGEQRPQVLAACGVLGPVLSDWPPSTHWNRRLSTRRLLRRRRVGQVDGVRHRPSPEQGQPPAPGFREVDDRLAAAEADLQLDHRS
jgi:hypothetical protein